MNSKWIWLIGSGLLGVFLGLLLSGAIVLILDVEPEEVVPTDHRTGSVSVSITEDYLNQVINESLPSLPGPFSLQRAHLDLRQNQRAAFATQLKFGPFEPVVEGQVGFHASEAGALMVQLLDVNIGRLTLRRLVPDVVIDNVNTLLEEEILARVGSAGLRIVGVESDATQLQIHLDAS